MQDGCKFYRSGNGVILTEGFDGAIPARWRSWVWLNLMCFDLWVYILCFLSLTLHVFGPWKLYVLMTSTLTTLNSDTSSGWQEKMGLSLPWHEIEAYQTFTHKSVHPVVQSSLQRCKYQSYSLITDQSWAEQEEVMVMVMVIELVLVDSRRTTTNSDK